MLVGFVVASRGEGRWLGRVDESCAGGGVLDRVAEVGHGRFGDVCRRSLVQVSVGSVLVVVLDEVLEEPSELALVPDEGLVEEFVANGADPSLRKGVGSGGPGSGGVGGDAGDVAPAE